MLFWSSGHTLNGSSCANGRSSHESGLHGDISVGQYPVYQGGCDREDGSEVPSHEGADERQARASYACCGFATCARYVARESIYPWLLVSCCDAASLTPGAQPKGYSAAILRIERDWISARHLASASPSGSSNAAVRALAIASAASCGAMAPASAGRISSRSISR